MVEVEEKYMARCIELAKGGRGNVSPNPMVGAVVVHKAVLSVRDFTGNVGSACRGECYRFRERRVFVERQYDLCESGALLSLWEDASLRRVDYPERDSTGGGRLLGSFSRGVGARCADVA